MNARYAPVFSGKVSSFSKAPASTSRSTAKQPANRLGCGGSGPEELKNHLSLLDSLGTQFLQQVKPEFQATIRTRRTLNFDSVFTGRIMTKSRVRIRMKVVKGMRRKGGSLASLGTSNVSDALHNDEIDQETA